MVKNVRHRLTADEPGWTQIHLLHENTERTTAEREEQRQRQICHGQHHHARGTAPAGGAADEHDSQPARHEAQKGGFIHRFLDDVRRFEPAAKTFLHQPVEVGQTFPPRPDLDIPKCKARELLNAWHITQPAGVG